MDPIDTLLRLPALLPQPRMARLKAQGAARGRALVSYLRSARWHPRDPRLNGHSNQWESRQTARTLARLGFDVDVIEFTDITFEPAGNYDLVLAIDGELQRLGDATGAGRLLLHQTGSHAPFQNAAEMRRLRELRERRGIECAPRRLVADVDGAVTALERASACSLIGNEATLATFPEQARGKITRIPVSGSVPVRSKSAAEVAASGPGFLWFFGSGAVHKGLDRVLEAFALEPSLTLHVVGNIGAEHDFIAAYRRELTELANIHWHGFLDPAGADFASVALQCSYAVAPSCSEGTSPATATAIQTGLYPIITRETGIDMPAGCGRYLEQSTVEEITRAVTDAASLAPAELHRQVGEAQRVALEKYSRPSFARAMHAYLAQAIDGPTLAT